jgi:hypothetical protein
MKRIALISVTVVRDGQRIATGPGSKYAGKPFDYTKEEIADVTRVSPNAFRKPVNESSEPEADDTTAPEGDASATANKTPKQPAKKKAAQKDSQSDAATKQTDQQSGEPSDTDEDADDDDDI